VSSYYQGYPWADGELSGLFHRPVSGYDRHYGLLLAALSAGALAIGLVLALVWLLIRRARAREALRISEEKYRQIVETAREGIWAVDSEFRTTFVNRRMADMLGYSMEEMIGRKLDTFVLEEELGDHNSRMEERRRGKGETYERRWRRRDDKPLWTLVSATPVRDAEGRFAGSFGMITDISVHKHAEEALRVSEEQYRLLVEKAQEGICVVQQSVMRFVNPRVEELFGYTADELIGKAITGFIHPDDRQMVLGRHDRRLKGEVFPTRYPIRVIDRSNRLRWVEIESVRVEWEGKPAVMVFLNDITYKKLAEEAAAKAERLRAVTELSAGVSHNFNNLLQIIVGNASLCLMDLKSGDVLGIKNNLEQMLEAATFGTETVRRLQTFAKVRADMTQGEAAIFDVTTTVKNVAEITRPLWKTEPEKKGVQVRLKLDLQDTLQVHGKESELFEAIVNLIRNAVDAMPEGGDLEIKTCRDAEAAVIQVRDTGTGIPQGDLDQIFEPFWTTKGMGLGTGMGLAVTLAVVQRHGGSIAVESRQGGGTEFTVRLSLAHAEVGPAQQPAMIPSARILTILLIEDVLPIVTSLERICTAQGHKVLRALSGEEGLSLFAENHVDMLICDLVMPGMNGWDIGKAIVSMCQEKGIAKPPFILLTGWDGREIETQRTVESGVDALITKPVNSAVLLATVQEIADRFDLGEDGGYTSSLSNM